MTRDDFTAAWPGASADDRFVDFLTWVRAELEDIIDLFPPLSVVRNPATANVQQLGVARVTLSRLIHGQSGISADMARRLEAGLGGPKRGPSAESWLRMQADYDLWLAMQQPAPKVVRARTAAL